jgi:catechol 2,3-dioxygenase-like lactoylglutathione lyase family enzyme
MSHLCGIGVMRGVTSAQPAERRRASDGARRAVRLLLLTLILVGWPVVVIALDGGRVEVERVAMIGFTVSDMDRSVAFYSDVLTFEKVADFRVNGPAYDQLEGVFGANMRIVHLKLGDQVVELTQYVSPPGGRPIPVPSRSNDLWFEHMAIVVSDMERAYAVLQRHQVRQISPAPQTIPPSNVPAAGIKALKFRDPDNHDLELIWFPPGKGAPRWQKPSDRLFLGIDHTAIAVSNTKASLAFYRDLLGMKVTGGSLNTGITQEYLDSVFGARVRVTAVSPPVEPPHVEFLEYEAPPGGRPMPVDTLANELWHWQTSLVVADVKSASEALRAAGVRFVGPAVVAIPDRSLGFANAIMVLDPDGHAMRLVEP